MLGCKHKLNLNGQNFEFNTTEELNEFLENNMNRISASLEGADVLFSKSFLASEETYAKIEALEKEKKTVTIEHENGNKREVVTLPGYKGVTSFIEQLTDENGVKVVQEFDIEAYRTRETTRLSEEYVQTGMPESQAVLAATKIVNDRILSWETITKNGTNIHKLAEIYFKDPMSDLSTLFKKETGLTLPYTSDVLSQITSVFDKIRNQITKGGDDSIILTEVYVKNETDDPENQVLGLIDLMAIRPDGSVDIYDFKTSFEQMSEWDADKNKRHMYQMAMYRQILGNMNIKVNSTNIIPVILESTDASRKHITSVKNNIGDPIENLNPSLFGAHSNIRFLVEGLFPTKVQKMKSPTNDKMNQNMELFFDIKQEDDYQARIEEFKERNLSKDASGKFYFIDNYNKITLNGDSNDDYIIKRYIQKGEEENRGMVKTIKDSMKSIVESIIANPKSSSNLLLSPLHNRSIVGRPDLKEWQLKELRTSNRVFKPYMNNDWDVVEIDALEDAGIITFRNIKTNRFDFVILTKDNLRQTVKLKKGTNIYGNFYSDHSTNIRVNKMPATRLNLEVIRLYSFLNDNIELIKDVGGSIGFIRGYDQSSAQSVVMADTGALQDAYRDLATASGIKSRIHELQTTSAATNLGYEIGNILSNHKELRVNENHLEQVKKIKNVIDSYQENNKIQTVRELVELKRDADNWIEQSTSINSMSTDSDLYKVYAWLNVTISELNGRPPSAESEDMSIYGMVNSTRMSTANEIEFETVKRALKPIRDAMNTLTDNYVKFKSKHYSMFEDYYDDHGVSTIIGNHITSFNNLYLRNANGDLDENFRFQNPDDMSNSLTSNEREFVRKMSRLFNDIFYDYTDAEHETNKRDNPDYYNVPISPANTESKIWGHGLSVDMVKDFWTNTSNNAFDIIQLFDEQRPENTDSSKMMRYMYDKFSISKDVVARKQQLEKVGVKAMQTNLEVILGDAYYTKARKNIYDNILPLVHATLISSHFYNAGHTTFNPENMHSYIEEYVKTTLFEEKLLEPNQIATHAIASRAKHVVSMLQLGLSPLNLIRETLQGYMTNIGRIWAKQYGQKESPDASHYHKAIAMMVADGKDFINNVTLIEEMNHFYRMADMDVNRLPEKMKISKTGISQFTSRWMLWFQSAPDYITRMSFLLAKMLKDGSFDAHTMVDGQMVYDWRLDQRFEAFANNRTSDPDYNFQKQLYIRMLKDINDEVATTGYGEYLNVDETTGELGDLPKAYTSTERDSIKAYINYSHGSYEHGEGILFKDTLFGVMIMQFRTWFLAKKTQWWMKQGKYTIGGYEQLKDIEGNLLYRKMLPDGTFDPNPTTDPSGDPIVEWKGKYMEGILQSITRTFRMVREGDASLMDVLKGMPNDDIIRSNLIMATSDLGMFLLIGMLIKGMIPWEDFDEDDSADKAISGLLSTAFYATNDLSIFHATQGVLDPDGMMPTVSTIFGLAESSYEAVFGGFNMNNFMNDNFALARFYNRMF